MLGTNDTCRQSPKPKYRPAPAAIVLSGVPPPPGTMKHCYIQSRVVHRTIIGGQPPYATASLAPYRRSGQATHDVKT